MTNLTDLTPGQWVQGLLAAVIGGFSGVMDNGIALIIIAPETFNLNAGLRKTLITLCVLGLLTGAKCMFAYLQQSPITRVQWTDAQRDIHKVTGVEPPTAAKAETVVVIPKP